MKVYLTVLLTFLILLGKITSENSTNTIITDTSPTTTVITPTTTATTPTTLFKTSTTAAPTVIATQMPALPGQSQAKVALTASYPYTYDNDYAIPSSNKFITFVNNILQTFIASFAKDRSVRVVAVIVYSLNPGSVVANMSVVLASNTTLNNSQITSQVASGLDPNATVQSVAVTEKSIVTDTTAISTTINSTTSAANITSPSSPTSSNVPTTSVTTPTTTATSMTVTSTTITPNSTPTTTVPTPTTQPTPKPTEISVRVATVCKFTDVFDLDLNIPTSSKYKSFTNMIFLRLLASFAKTGYLRLVKIIFYSFSRGSTIANMTLEMASNITVNPSMVASQLNSSISEAFGPNVTVVSLGDIFIGTPTTAASPTGLQPLIVIALIVIFSIIGAFLLSIAIILIIVYAHRKRFDNHQSDPDPASSSVLKELNYGTV